MMQYGELLFTFLLSLFFSSYHRLTSQQHISLCWLSGARKKRRNGHHSHSPAYINIQYIYCIRNIQLPQTITFFAMEATLCDIRRAVLTGKLFTGKMDAGNVETPSCCKWAVPSKMLTVFVSSTFTDTQVERNILLAIRSRLLEEVRAHGIQINLVDMRFGVKDENTLTHNTWTHCAREIYNCHEQSGGVYFLSLQSHKYGYMPLPKHLSEEECNKSWLCLMTRRCAL
jgi:hypothetical protein